MQFEKQAATTSRRPAYTDLNEYDLVVEPITFDLKCYGQLDTADKYFCIVWYYSIYSRGMNKFEYELKQHYTLSETNIGATPDQLYELVHYTFNYLSMSFDAEKFDCGIPGMIRISSLEEDEVKAAVEALQQSLLPLTYH